MSGDASIVEAGAGSEEARAEHGLKSFEQVIDDLTGFWRSAMIAAAFELHLPEHVRAGRDTAEAIAEEEGADPDRLERLLNALCGLGYLDKQNGRYGVDPLVEAILDLGFGDTVAHWVNEIEWTQARRLADVIRSGRRETVLYDHEFWLDFARATFSAARLQGLAAADLIGLQPGSHTRVLDVGCGSGGVGFALATIDPTATVTGVDGGGVLEIAAENAVELDIADRVTLRRADVLADESFGEDAFDVAIVSNVLHHCDPEPARQLLRKVARALAPGGRAVIMDVVPDDDRRVLAHQLMFGVIQMLTTPGNSYTYAEIGGWLTGAGLENVEHQRMDGYTSTIVGVKP